MRTPTAKEGQLKVQYGKVPYEKSTDIVYAWGEGTSRSDIRLIHNMLTGERYSVLTGEWEKSPLDELIERGYDITTLKITIEKKK